MASFLNLNAPEKCVGVKSNTKKIFSRFNKVKIVLKSDSSREEYLFLTVTSQK